MDRRQIGISFYGGVSLAVFEAGVAYELARAVEFSRQSKKRPDLHVDVISGTSAGGLAAVQLAALLAGTRRQEVLRRMWSIWANDADILRLIPDSGFKRQGVLDNSILGDRVQELLAEAAGGDAADALEQDMDVYLTLTNFSGLREPVLPPGARTQDEAVPTTRHAEYEHFSAADVLQTEQHQRWKQAALITAGFPVAFPPTEKTSAALPAKVDTRFLYVDGGLVDNRPLGIALDAVAERPAASRLFFFVDPSESHLTPTQTGRTPGSTDRADPLGIARNLFNVARADSVYHDVQRAHDDSHRQGILGTLAASVLADSGFRGMLLQSYPDIVVREFNAPAARFWDRFEHQAEPQTRSVWNRLRGQERYTLRARLDEYLHHQQAIGAITEEQLRAATAALNDPGSWRDYYKALRNLRRQNREFRDLGYWLWNGQLDDSFQQRGHTALETLVQQHEHLKQVRDTLGDDILGRAGITSSADFLEYARAMQVLESLSGVRSAGSYRMQRITPFDIYERGADRKAAHPLAGGSFGAFGGFLSKRWRLNDLLVGRLAMRQRLLGEQLIEKDDFERYLRYCNEKDAEVAGKLASGSSERNALEALARLRPADCGPYAGDSAKPIGPGLLLSATDMDPDELPGWRMAKVARGVIRGVQGVVGRNPGRLVYDLIARFQWLGYLLRGLLYVVQQTMMPDQETEPDNFAMMRRRITRMLILLAVGFVAGALVFR